MLSFTVWADILLFSRIMYVSLKRPKYTLKTNTRIVVKRTCNNPLGKREHVVKMMLYLHIWIANNICK